jgi:hypothetical protein
MGRHRLSDYRDQTTRASTSAQRNLARRARAFFLRLVGSAPLDCVHLRIQTFLRSRTRTRCTRRRSSSSVGLLYAVGSAFARGIERIARFQCGQALRRPFPISGHRDQPCHAGSGCVVDRRTTSLVERELTFDPARTDCLALTGAYINRQDCIPRIGCLSYPQLGRYVRGKHGARSDVGGTAF